MLSEAEQQRLAEIESQLQGDDPIFVQRFDGAGQRRHGRRSLALTLALVVTVTVTGVGLVLASVGTVVVALTALGASLSMWTMDRRRGRS